MASRKLILLAPVWLAASGLYGGVVAQFNLAKDSPVKLLSSEYGESNETARGGAMLLDLHAALSFENSSRRRIRGITLLVTALSEADGRRASLRAPAPCSGCTGSC